MGRRDDKSSVFEPDLNEERFLFHQVPCRASFAPSPAPSGQQAEAPWARRSDHEAVR
jgi:hypothetical protein